MQDYKMVMRGLSNVSVPAAGVQNFSEFNTVLNEQYLAQGYTVLSVDLVRVLTTEGQPPVYEFAYHLVKEISKK